MPPPPPPPPPPPRFGKRRASTAVLTMATTTATSATAIDAYSRPVSELIVDCAVVSWAFVEFRLFCRLRIVLFSVSSCTLTIPSMYAICEIAVKDAVEKDGTAASAPTVIVWSVNAPGASAAVCAPFKAISHFPAAGRVGVAGTTTECVAGVSTIHDELTASYGAPCKVVVRLKDAGRPFRIWDGPASAVAGTFGTIRLAKWSARNG